MNLIIYCLFVIMMQKIVLDDSLNDLRIKDLMLQYDRDKLSLIIDQSIIYDMNNDKYYAKSNLLKDRYVIKEDDLIILYNSEYYLILKILVEKHNIKLPKTRLRKYLNKFIEKGDIGHVKFLIKYDVSYDKLSKDIASFKGYDNIVSYLEKYGKEEL